VTVLTVEVTVVGTLDVRVVSEVLVDVVEVRVDVVVVVS